jgi:hypothetical protein
MVNKIIDDSIRALIENGVHTKQRSRGVMRDIFWGRQEIQWEIPIQERL